MKALLDNVALDYDKVLETAVKITEKDNNNIRFSVDANLVRRLGEQLVAKKTTAVSELVKNAYDADSTLVNVYFELNEANPRIVIFDDGTGMSKEDIINGFMRISTSEKEDNSVSERYQRLRAGRKGIGRFSTQRLGNYLKIITKQENEELGYLIEINWQQFSKRKIYPSLLTLSQKSMWISFMEQK